MDTPKFRKYYVSEDPNKLSLFAKIGDEVVGVAVFHIDVYPGDEESTTH